MYLRERYPNHRESVFVKETLDILVDTKDLGGDTGLLYQLLIMFLSLLSDTVVIV
jgi:hypothetical protein